MTTRDRERTARDGECAYNPPNAYSVLDGLAKRSDTMGPWTADQLCELEEMHNPEDERPSAEQLARFVREHGFPCRVTAAPCFEALRFAIPCKSPDAKHFGWEIREVPALLGIVKSELGY